MRPIKGVSASAAFLLLAALLLLTLGQAQAQPVTTGGPWFRATCNTTNLANPTAAGLAACWDQGRNALMGWDGTGWQSSLASKYVVVTDPRWGAVGDGVTDNYAALRLVARAVCAPGGTGGTVIFPPGTYKIDQVRQYTAGVGEGEPDTLSTNGINDIIWKNCNGLRILGYGAKIDIKGNVNRVIDWGGVNGFSVLAMVRPFYIWNSTNVEIAGFELDGNVDLQTNAAGIQPNSATFITVVGSKRVRIHNNWMHHSWTDAIDIARNRGATPQDISRDVTIENNYIHNSPRCNIAVLETKNVIIRNNRLDYGGNSNGAANTQYTPGCNIDIEPDVAPPTVEAATSQILVENNQMTNSYLRNFAVNVRTTFVIVRGNYIDNIPNDLQPVTLGIPFGVLEDNDISTGTGRIDVAVSGTDGGNVVYIRRNKITANRGDGLLVSGQGGRLKQAIIEGNRFIQTGSPLTGRFPSLSHGDDALQIIFRDNYVFLPTAAHPGGGQFISTDMHVQLAENNTYETDLSHGTNYFAVLYTDNGVRPQFGTLALNERFISPNNLSFRPGDNTAHDNTLPFTLGVASGGDRTLIGELLIRQGSAAPSAGGGVAALQGSVYLRSTNGEVWVKTGAGATAWTQLVASATPLIATLGGTGLASYAVGDLLTAPTTTTLAAIADVAAGAYLRSGGVGVIPLWSTLILPNAITANNVVYGSATNTYGSSTGFVFDGTSVGIGATAPIFLLDVLSGTANTGANVNNPSQLEVTGPTKALTAGGATVFLNSNSNQAADAGASIALTGRTTDASTTSSVFAVVKGAKENATSGNVDGYVAIAVQSQSAGALVERARIGSAGGMQIGSPTGGDKGAGTLNATAILINNRLLTDASGTLTNASVTFASGLPNTLTANGMHIYCSDCDPTATLLACTSVGSKTGALAIRTGGNVSCIGR